MGLVNKLVNMMKVNADSPEDEEFFDEDEDLDVETEEKKTRFFNRFRSKDKYDDDYDEEYDDYDDYDEDEEDDKKERSSSRFSAKKESSSAKSASSEKASRKETVRKSKVTPIRKRTSENNAIRIKLIHPNSFGDAQDVADALIESYIVFLNLEGIDLDTAQRIFDFASGVVYSLYGSLTQFSNYTYVIAPEGADVSGAIDTFMQKDFTVPGVRNHY